MESDPLPEGVRTEKLIERALAGDREAERLLFEPHHGWLIAKARRHPSTREVERRSSWTPEDLAQEVIRRMLDSGLLNRFEDHGPGSLRRALGSILDRVIWDRLRRAGALKRSADVLGMSCDDGGGALLPEVPASSSEPTPSSSARAAEFREKAKALLSGVEWEVFRLSLEGLNSVEIASRLGKADSTVREAHARAKAKLRSLFSRGGD